MKKTMPDYMNAMTGGNLETLEMIISRQYRKFVRFYKLVSSYSDNIKGLQYEFNSPLSLDVLLEFDSKKPLETIKKDLEKLMVKKNYDGSVKISKKRVMISIVLPEETDKVISIEEEVVE